MGHRCRQGKCHGCTGSSWHGEFHDVVDSVCVCVCVCVCVVLCFVILVAHIICTPTRTRPLCRLKCLSSPRKFSIVCAYFSKYHAPICLCWRGGLLQVWVNAHSDLTGAPFGGFKWSGVGRELGKADVEAFTEAKTLQLAK